MVLHIVDRLSIISIPLTIYQRSVEARLLLLSFLPFHVSHPKLCVESVNRAKRAIGKSTYGVLAHILLC